MSFREYLYQAFSQLLMVPKKTLSSAYSYLRLDVLAMYWGVQTPDLHQTHSSFFTKEKHFLKKLLPCTHERSGGRERKREREEEKEHFLMGYGHAAIFFPSFLQPKGFGVYTCSVFFKLWGQDLNCSQPHGIWLSTQGLFTELGAGPDMFFLKIKCVYKNWQKIAM